MFRQMNISFLFMAKGYSGIWRGHICVVSLLMDIWAATPSSRCDNAALSRIPGSGIGGSYDNSVSLFWEPPDLSSAAAPSYTSSGRVPASPHPPRGQLPRRLGCGLAGVRTWAARIRKPAWGVGCTPELPLSFEPLTPFHWDILQSVTSFSKRGLQTPMLLPFFLSSDLRSQRKFFLLSLLFLHMQ